MPLSRVSPAAQRCHPSSPVRLLSFVRGCEQAWRLLQITASFLAARLLPLIAGDCWAERGSTNQAYQRQGEFPSRAPRGQVRHPSSGMIPVAAESGASAGASVASEADAPDSDTRSGVAT